MAAFLADARVKFSFPSGRGDPAAGSLQRARVDRPKRGALGPPAPGSIRIERLPGDGRDGSG